MSAEDVPGLHGRIPAYRDVVTRNLRSEFVLTWNQWIQRSMPVAQDNLGSEWLDTYLTSPLWRFVFSAGLVGQNVWCGVMMPSVDRTGQYYPFMLAQPLPATTLPTALFSEAELWFQALEQIALESLQPDGTLQQIESRLHALPRPETRVNTAATGWEMNRPVAVNLTVSPYNPLQSYPSLLHELLRQRYPSYSLWWSMGSERVAPAQLISGYLPTPQCYTSLLAGDWDERGWDTPFATNAI
ncbi:type VI secretion system-associated protein TagF [Ketobacter sp. MCCC 1A13808]|uniref:type VI secretion system-associated protein TagF n=1 Tax=Ketobacter sp. MCCC 1A13808 TaxID=2602738 RepID=UPI000F2774B9|nr:type VI secretion system-associated protein TagF [Ketobacter sp. MCCC 1A13808]MVF13286.1 type VI secretion system-associated protein TagF [Ketobacter sp. MCCC 1A13808]RLP54276.1 MAG: type VI secretion system-associated protein TagF [Ketobacter sp.]